MYESTIETIDRTASRACSPAPDGVAFAHVGRVRPSAASALRLLMTVGRTEAAIAAVAGKNSAHRDRGFVAVPMTTVPNARTTYDPGSQPWKQPV